MTAIEAIKEYQCSGCSNGTYESCPCFKQGIFHKGCINHCPGTVIPGIGTVFLGMPKGFDRLGKNKPFIQLFDSLEDVLENWGEYYVFDIPVWKYLDKFGNILVKVFQPRVNHCCIHIILNKDDFDRINATYTLTDKQIEEMD